MKYRLSPADTGIILHVVQIVPYNANWPAMARQIADQVSMVLKDNLVTVEHIGSTSIPGIAAKPVIDLIPIVYDLSILDTQQQLITGLGYRWHGEFGIPGRRFCSFTNKAGKRLIHLHCFQEDAVAIERHLAFRDYMRAHPDLSAAYEMEKKRAAALYPDDSLAYNDEKAAWVQQHEKEALLWYRSHK